MDAEFERLRREAKERSAEKDLMKMHWQCQACFLEGRDDYMKPMGDFNVRCPADFVNKLLPQGAWTRCSRCVRLLSKSKGHAVQTEAAARMHVCNKCGKDTPREEFWPEDWVRNRHRGIACMVCKIGIPCRTLRHLRTW